LNDKTWHAEKNARIARPVNSGKRKFTSRKRLRAQRRARHQKELCPSALRAHTSERLCHRLGVHSRAELMLRIVDE
jgi:hypothetical protein